MENEITQQKGKSKKLSLAKIVIFLFIVGVLIMLQKENPNAEKINNFQVSSQEDIDKLKKEVNKSLNYDLAITETGRYKSEIIEWGGKVFVEPEYDSSGVYMQVYYKNISEKPFIIKYSKNDFKIKKDDYIIVTGQLVDIYEGDNAFGGKVRGVVINAGLIELAKRANVIAPTQKTVNLDKTKSKAQFFVTLEKIELAEEETRFYLKIKNLSEDKVYFYANNAKISQAGQQLEAEYIFDDPDSLPTEFLPEVEISGVLVFPAINDSINSLKLYVEDFVFEISLPD